MARHSGGDAVLHTDRHEHWRAHVDAQARGSLSQRAYCEDHGLAYSSFTYWRRRLHEPRTPISTSAASAQPATATGFVPVTLAPPVTRQAQSAALAVVLPGGLRIEGVDAANVATVAALVAAL